MRNPAPWPRLLLMVAAATLALSGCAVTNWLFRDTAAEDRAAALLQLQLGIMRFADEYAARINERIVTLQQTTDSPRERLASQSWLVSQATWAFTIAAGLNPELNTIDMLVFATLSRMVIEDHWVGELHNHRAADLLATHKALETQIWEYSTVLLSEAQIAELRSSIDAWHRKNPLMRAVPFVHLEDFAFATGQARSKTSSSGSIFSFLGIDPLSNLDPAVRELARSRQLAERAVYYGQRTPKLIGMEAQRLAFEMAAAPESVRLIDSIDRVGGAAKTTSELAADLPRLLAAERAATIEQLTGVLDERQGELRALAVELRSTLEAGGAASDSVRQAIVALDALIARFDRPASQGAGSSARPFDVTEYTAALQQLGETAQQVQALLDQADGKAPALARASDRAVSGLASVVDRIYWRLVQLAFMLVVAGVSGALAYRAIARRLG